jgi:hypothetical protein
VSQYIAERLLSINEQKRWAEETPADETIKLKQDEEIFQTARLIKYVCHLYLRQTSCYMLSQLWTFLECDDVGLPSCIPRTF